MDIPNIPESISRQRYMDLLHALGLEDLTCLRSVTLGAKHISVEMMAKDETGHLIVDQLANAVVVHHVAIPIVEDDPGTEWTTIPGADGPVTVRSA